MSSPSQPNSTPSSLDAEIRQAIDGMRRGDRNVLDRMDGLMAEIRRVLEGISKGQSMSASFDRIQSTLEEVRKELGRHESMIAQQSTEATQRSAEEKRSWAASADALTNVAEALTLLDKTVSDQTGRFPGLEQSIASACQKISLLLESSFAERGALTVEPVVSAIDSRLVKIAVGLEAAIRGLFHRVEDVEKQGLGLEARLADRMERVANAIRQKGPNQEDIASRTALEGSIAVLGKTVSAVADGIAASQQDSVLRSEARQQLLSDKLNRIYKAIQDQQPTPPTDITPVTDAVGNLDKRFDTVLQKIEGLSLKATRLEFLSSEQSRSDATGEKLSALEKSVSGVDGKLEDVSSKISSLHQDAALRLEAKQSLVAEKLNRILKAIQDQTAAAPEPQPQDLTPVTDAVGALDKRFDTVLQKIEGLSLKATRLEFMAGETARGDANDPGAATIKDTVSGVDKKLGEISEKLSALHQETVLRGEASQSLVTEKLGRILKSMQSQVAAPGAPEVDLGPISDAVGALGKKLEAVLQKIEGVSLKATRIEFLASEQASRPSPDGSAHIELHRTSSEGAASSQGLDHGLSLLTAEVQRLANEVSEVRGAVTSTSSSQGPSDAGVGSQLGEIARMVSAGNAALAELHAMAARTPLAATGGGLPSWTEAWQVINLINVAFDRRFSDFSDRLDRLSVGLSDAGAGLDNDRLASVGEFRSSLMKARDELRQDVERFLSIAACLSSEMEELAPKVLMSRSAA